MPRGPGKYDDECLKVMESTGALGVILIVLGGNQGSGFSVNSLSPELEGKLPAMLRNVANQIEGS